MGRVYRVLSALLPLLLLLTACGLKREQRHIPEIPRNEREMTEFTLDEKGRPAYPGALLGVDVSELQGEIDWQRVRADGVDFAILRVGYRGNTEGGLLQDERFAANYAAARAAGLRVGVYFFSQALSEQEARDEAAFVLELLNGAELELPVFFDWEEQTEGRTAGRALSAVGDWALCFCREITQGGYQAGVYFNQRYGYSIMRLENLTDYAFWIAEYENWQSFGYQTAFWQFTGSGRADGIDVIVDMDLMYPEEEEHE